MPDRNTLHSELDHIVLVAPALESGAAFCERLLGVSLAAGGEHARMATHNQLLNLGGGVYLEVIAINPAAGEPELPRWFGMDSPEERKRAAAGTYLSTFVARTTDIDAASRALPAAGKVTEMRRGQLQWRITIPEQSTLVERGALPTLIQWPDGVHPTQSLPASGCTLERLEVFHPEPDRIAQQWSGAGLRGGSRLLLRKADAGNAPHLVAHIATPGGTVVLR